MDRAALIEAMQKIAAQPIPDPRREVFVPRGTPPDVIRRMVVEYGARVLVHPDDMAAVQKLADEDTRV